MVEVAFMNEFIFRVYPLYSYKYCHGGHLLLQVRGLNTHLQYYKTIQIVVVNVYVAFDL